MEEQVTAADVQADRLLVRVQVEVSADAEGWDKERVTVDIEAGTVADALDQVRQLREAGLLHTILPRGPE